MKEKSDSNVDLLHKIKDDPDSTSSLHENE
jgi:hypothetical protein